MTKKTALQELNSIKDDLRRIPKFDGKDDAIQAVKNSIDLLNKHTLQEKNMQLLVRTAADTLGFAQAITNAAKNQSTEPTKEKAVFA